MSAVAGLPSERGNLKSWPCKGKNQRNRDLQLLLVGLGTCSAMALIFLQPIHEAGTAGATLDGTTHESSAQSNDISSRQTGASSCCQQCVEEENATIYHNGSQWGLHKHSQAVPAPAEMAQIFEQPGHAYVFADSLGPSATMMFSRECCRCPREQIGQVLILVRHS